jgi:hypothetical protein
MFLRKCRHCGTEAVTHEDLTKFTKGDRSKHGHDNCCKACANKRVNADRNLVNKDDPKILQSIASRELIRKRRETTPSWIYVITNKHYDGWCKLGRTTKKNINDRLSQYNTYCPTNSFVLEFSEWFEDSRIEGDIMDSLLINNIENNREWFKCSVETMLHHIKNYKQIIQSYKDEIALKQCKSVIQLTKDGQFIAEYKSITEASKVTGVHAGSIGYVATNGVRKLKTTGGFMWKLKSDYDKNKPEILADRQAWRDEIRQLEATL